MLRSRAHIGEWTDVVGLDPRALPGSRLDLMSFGSESSG